MSYTVQTGDTISAVTRKLNTSFADLKRTNPNAFGRTSKGRWFLYAGAEVSQSSGNVGQARVPAPAPARPKPNAPVPTSVPPKPNQSVLQSSGGRPGTYVVQPGETVTGVSRKLGQPFRVLKELNPEAVGRTKDGRWFFLAGATLDIPSSFNGALIKATKNLSPPKARPKSRQATSYTKPKPAQQLSYSRPAPSTPKRTTPEQTSLPVYHSLVGRGGSTRTQTQAPKPPAPAAPRSRVVRSPAKTSSAPQTKPRQPVPPSYPRASNYQTSRPVLSVDEFKPRVVSGFNQSDHNMAPIKAQQELGRLRSRISPQVDLTVGVVKDNLPRGGVNNSPGNFFKSGGVTVGFRIEF